MTEQPQAQEQELRLSVSDREILQKKDFRADERGRDRRGHACDRENAVAAGGASDPRTARPARLRLDHAPHLRGSCAPAARSSISASWPDRETRRSVALLDISGSMSEYTRCSSLPACITDAASASPVFLFGTRLTNVTRALRRATRTSAGKKLLQEWRTGPAHKDRDLAAYV